ncbi:SDR family oxidoreductase [Nonomuraea sediminis]|uniref:SDR family oxidoreductase n=1 Tax=Nonomuraea sediminis TaxID=2835864 RepID=UPI001BDD1092|nr:NmrA family NAD(P)-binding protein [Nonomuraea sediminis]
MTFLVMGASGAQGSAITQALTAAGHEARGFSRTAGFRGDLGDAERVKEAFAGVTHASLLLPMVYSPLTVETYVRNVIDAASAAGVRRLVFNTGNRIPPGPTGVAAFETRRAAATALLESGLPVVVLRPPIYLDNVLAPWVAGPLAAGVLRYPVPAHVPVSWLTHADLGAATVAALTRPGIEGRQLDLGPAPLTGPSLAALFGPDVRYEAQDVAEFEGALAAALGAETAAGVAGTYHWVAEHGRDLYVADPTVEDLLGLHFQPPAEWIASR